MKLTSSSKLAQTLVWLAVGCSPQAGLEDGDGSTSAGSSTGPGQTSTDPTTTGSSMPTTTGSDDATTTGVDLDDGGSSTGVVIPEDCSILEQDCPGGYKCMPWADDGGNSWNDTKCVPIVEDPNAAGQPCTYLAGPWSGEDDCDASSMCWGLSPETDIGTCQPFCMGPEENPTCADSCQVCPQLGDGPTFLCFDTCDPLASSCGPGEGCYGINDYFQCVPDGSPMGTDIGSPCEFINACPAGMACLGADAVPGCVDGTGCCVPYCSVGGADPCPGLLPGTTCTPWYDEGENPQEQCQLAPPGVCIQ
jgi:hypothetical protein